MSEAYIVGAIRTATGRKKGRLSGLHPVDMGAIVVDELLDQTGVPSDGVDDVIFGVVSQIGSQAGNLGRNVAMSSKLDLEVPGTTVDRQCGSSLQAIQFGAQAVMSGTQDVIICGGVEAMSTVEIGSNIRDGLEHGRGTPKGERLELQYPGIQFSQFDGAELLAEKYEITRDELDAFGLRSHQKASQATNSGLFENALEVFREVRRIDPLFPQFVVLGEARAYLSLKKYSEALKLSEEALRRNPRSARAMLCYITAAWQLGQKEDAIWQLEELSVNVPDLDTDAMLQKAPWHTTTKDIISKSLSLVKSEMKQ